MKRNIVPPSKAAAGLCESCAKAAPDHINVGTNPTMAPDTETRHKPAFIRMASSGGKIRTCDRAYSPPVARKYMPEQACATSCMSDSLGQTIPKKDPHSSRTSLDGHLSYG